MPQRQSLSQTSVLLSWSVPPNPCGQHDYVDRGRDRHADDRYKQDAGHRSSSRVGSERDCCHSRLALTVIPIRRAESRTTAGGLGPSRIRRPVRRPMPPLRDVTLGHFAVGAEAQANAESGDLVVEEDCVGLAVELERGDGILGELHACFPTAAIPAGEPLGKLPDGSPRHFLALRSKKKKLKPLRPWASGSFPASAGLAVTVPF